MKAAFAIALLLVGSTAIAQHDLDYFRSSFHASQTEDALDLIIETSPEEDNELNLATIMAYKAVSETMKADHKLLPFSKLQLFNSGREKLEAVISRYPTPEIRYLRLLVQLNVPGIVNYSDNIEEDLQHLSVALRSEYFPQQEKLLFIQTLTSMMNDQDYLSIIKKIELN